MKMITFEVSDRSLAVTTIALSNEQWNCSVVVSQLNSGHDEVFHRSEHMAFSGLHDPETALDLALDFTSSYRELLSQPSQGSVVTTLGCAAGLAAAPCSCFPRAEYRHTPPGSLPEAAIHNGDRASKPAKELVHAFRVFTRIFTNPDN